MEEMVRFGMAPDRNVMSMVALLPEKDGFLTYCGVELPYTAEQQA